MNYEILITGFIIFFARICDVTLGTFRTIVTIQGRSLLAFILGFFEILIWIAVISTVIQKVMSSPILCLFYAFGFAAGNAVGIFVERKMALGFFILRVFTKNAGERIAHELRKQGQVVTKLEGEGMYGKVAVLYVICRRKNIKWILQIVLKEDPQAFYITEMAKDVSKVLYPTATPATGWRAVLKKK
ncbi:MAG: DUF2179 domain-containing protein [Candidatus Kuenenia sp.]|nr:DUF2179 domain-containing protein [Candidatus Kuenenia hertensis]